MKFKSICSYCGEEYYYNKSIGQYIAGDILAFPISRGYIEFQCPRCRRAIRESDELREKEHKRLWLKERNRIEKFMHRRKI